MENDWNIKINDVGYKLEMDVYIFRKLFNGKIEILGVGEIDSYGVSPKPTLSLTKDQLQKFANALNGLGINPQKEYTQGKLEATENHLQDMRTLLKLNLTRPTAPPQ